MAVRITENLMSYNYVRTLNKSLIKQDELNKQASSGKTVLKPSDDPVKTIRSLTFSSNLSQNDQYTQNLKDAQSWMNTTDSAMSDFSDIMIKIKESVVNAANGDKNEMPVQTIGKEIDNLINQMVSLGNTQIGDRYIFAGQKDKTEPFSRDATTGMVKYMGDANKVSMVVNVGAEAKPVEDSVNLTGIDLFGEGGVKIINQLNEIKQHLESGTKEDQEWLSKVGLGYIEEGHDYMLQSHAELGTRMATYDMTENILSENGITINANLSANEDADMAEVIMKYKVAESSYKAALSIGAQILPLSLVDFMN